jgi:hypothetical protein
MLFGVDKPAAPATPRPAAAPVVDLTFWTAKELRAALGRAIAVADLTKAEVRDGCRTSAWFPWRDVSGDPVNRVHWIAAESLLRPVLPGLG